MAVVFKQWTVDCECGCTSVSKHADCHVQGCKVLCPVLHHQASADLRYRHSCIIWNSIIIFRRRCSIDSLKRISVYWSTRNSSTRCRYMYDMSVTRVSMWCTSAATVSVQDAGTCTTCQWRVSVCVVYLSCHGVSTRCRYMYDMSVTRVSM